MSAGKVLIGIVAGAAAGAALGILFAPEKGSMTRSQISKKGECFLNSFKAKFDAIISKATNDLADAKDEAEDLLAKGKEKAEKVKNDFKNAANPL